MGLRVVTPNPTKTANPNQTNRPGQGAHNGSDDLEYHPPRPEIYATTCANIAEYSVLTKVPKYASHRT